MNRFDDNRDIRDDGIRDDEFRVLGKREEQKEWGHRKVLITSSVVAAAVILTVTVVLLCTKSKPGDGANEPGFYETELADSSSLERRSEETELPERLGTYKDTIHAYTEHIEMTINDIPIDIYIPHNATPRLFVGTPRLDDRDVVFTTQAADIRADNGKIVGAFVLNGKPLTWGLSKRGYCGIIDGKVSIGVADNSPLFEEATEKGGFFFRQYPLVDNHRIVENQPKGKSIRKALCERNGEIFVAMSATQESFHDFAQALADLGVGNAVYLVGSVSYGYYRDETGKLSVIYDKRRGGQRYENHIQWVEHN